MMPADQPVTCRGIKNWLDNRQKTGSKFRNFPAKKKKKTIASGRRRNAGVFVIA